MAYDCKPQSRILDGDKSKIHAAGNTVHCRIIEFLGYDQILDPESFLEKLKTYRLRLGFSQRKLAAKFGVDPSTIYHWERGGA